ncbi:DUF397 domain-containing protein [Nocardiopsis sp. LOL_012]|uniref:DUF397 domain-containing protein n=1 Tax=Nocardiopsis sp. LOL_012 TaxID=3345409 RepID=UPI003A86CA75
MLLCSQGTCPVSESGRRSLTAPRSDQARHAHRPGRHHHHSTTELTFHGSSYSDSGDHCAEVADVPGGTAALRDSMNPRQGRFLVPRTDRAVLPHTVRREEGCQGNGSARPRSSGCSGGTASSNRQEGTSPLPQAGPW